MLDVYKLGPFLISYKFIILGISGIIGYLVLLVNLKSRNDIKKNVIDIISTSIIIIFLTWKFGGILFNPKQLLSNPLNILFLSGSNITFFGGLIFTSVYIFYKTNKIGIPLNTFLDLISYSILSFLLTSNLFNLEYGYRTNVPWGISLTNNNVVYHPINFYFAFMLLIIIMYCIKTNREFGNGNLFAKTAILTGICGLLLTFLSPQTIYILDISQKQLLFIFIIILGSLPVYLNKGNIKNR